MVLSTEETELRYGPSFSDVQAPFLPLTLNPGLQELFPFLWMFNTQLIHTTIFR